VLFGLTSLSAVLLAGPFAWISNRFSWGKWTIMVGGGTCFVVGGGALLVADDAKIAQWGFIVPYFMLHGVARGVWESTNKAVVADYFTDQDTRETAFATIYATSGLAGALGYLFFALMTREQLAFLNVLVAAVSLVSYHQSSC
jgi:hypothetical protein